MNGSKTLELTVLWNSRSESTDETSEEFIEEDEESDVDDED
jgi:hypothetical protein